MAPVGGNVDADVEVDAEQVARSICLRQLTMGPRTRGQLAEALRRRNVPDTAAERVLDRLSEVGLIDDAAYAEAWVRSRHAGRGLAREALARELSDRGVDGALVARAVDTVEPEQEYETARRLAARALRSSRGIDPQRRLRRAVGSLGRRGYPTALAVRVVREALDEEGSAPT